MEKPQKTLADYLVVAISPILIMVLVGSLAFFLIQLLYHGNMIQQIRWVMFWFVFAIVLVSRVSIEQGKGHARFYGAALAIATLFFLIHTHTVPSLAILLLAITWWCAHQLTVDCTLIDDNEDASGEGVLQGFLHKLEENLLATQTPPRIGPPVIANVSERRRQRPPRRPGRSVIYFSIAALPLFGIGQLLLPTDNPDARRIGFAFLAAYLGAALSLLMTTSFLGLRRYLRQRSVEMPTNVAFGWVKFGVVLAGSVLLVAMLLPRPGAQRTWKDLVPHFEQKKQKASDFAFPWNPPGEDEGQPTTRPNDRPQAAVKPRPAPPGQGSATPQQNPQRQSNPNNSSSRPSQSQGGGGTGNGGQDGQGGDGSQNGQPPQRAKNGEFGSVQPSGNTDSSNDGGQGGSDDGQDGNRGQMNPPEMRGGGGEEVDRPIRTQPGAEPKPQKPPEQRVRPQALQPEQPRPQPQEQRTTPPKTPRPPIPWLRILMIIVVASVLLWLLIKHRKAVAEAMRAFVRAVREYMTAFYHWLRNLFRFRKRQNVSPMEETPDAPPALEPFASYTNPFLTPQTWPPEKLVRYTYETLLSWAKEQGIEMEPQQTPREFCARLIERFPDCGPELERFSFFYSHVAFAERLPDDFEIEPLRRLWQYMGDSVASVHVN